MSFLCQKRAKREREPRGAPLEELSLLGHCAKGKGAVAASFCSFVNAAAMLFSISQQLLHIDASQHVKLLLFLFIVQKVFRKKMYTETVLSKVLDLELLLHSKKVSKYIEARSFNYEINIVGADLCVLNIL